MYYLFDYGGFMDSQDEKKGPPKPDQTDEPLDHLAYFKDLRNEFLVKLGLPKNTKPSQVKKMLELKLELDKIKKKQQH